DLQRRLDVGAARGEAASRPAGPRASAEHAAEQVVQVDVLETAALAPALPERMAPRPAPRAPAEAAELLPAVSVDFAPVELGALLGIAQQIERRRHPLEALVSLAVS